MLKLFPVLQRYQCFILYVVILLIYYFTNYQLASSHGFNHVGALIVFHSKHTVSNTQWQVC